MYVYVLCNVLFMVTILSLVFRPIKLFDLISFYSLSSVPGNHVMNFLTVLDDPQVCTIIAIVSQ